MTTAPMLSLCHRPQPCKYGCCRPDWTGRGKKNKRIITRRSRRAEQRLLQKEILQDG